ncbi:MAG: hypothetical protein AAFX05_04225 [Planctomycetota bacterium]
MNVHAGDLLQQLAAGIRPDGGQSVQLRLPTGATPFADVLGRVQSGELSSGVPVTLSPGTDVQLDAAQLERLASVVDQAEAQGASQLVAMIDGTAVTVDVAARQVTGTATGLTTSIDAFATVPSADSLTDALLRGDWMGGLQSVSNAALAQVLGSR